MPSGLVRFAHRLIITTLVITDVIPLMMRIKFTLRFLFIAMTVCAVAVYLYLNPSLRTSFMRMHRSSKHTNSLKVYSFLNLSDLERPEFEDGVNPVLLPVLDRIEEPLPAELLNYLRTSMPKKRYESYHWTFLPAEEVAALNIDDGICSIENGYFVFAWTDYGYGAVSLKDGRFYFNHGFSKDDSSPTCEAESIADLLRQQTQNFVNHKW